jgi:translocation and assembly module TamB
MKRVTIYITFYLLLFVVGGSWFVLNSQWGLDRTYELVRYSIPGKLDIHSLRGKLLGPITFSGISYVSNGVHIKLERLDFDWQADRLLIGTLRITKLDAKDLTVQLTDAAGQDKSAAPSSFILPLTIEMLDVRLKSARIIIGQQQPFSITQLILQATAHADSVQITQLNIESETFDLMTQGKVGFDSTYPVELHTSWSARFAGYTPLKGTGIFTGSLTQLKLEQTIQQPGLDVTLHGLLTDIISHFGWNLTLDIRQFTAQEFARSWPRISSQGKIQSTGHLDAFRLSGDLLNSLHEQGSVRSNFEINATPEIWYLTNFNASHSPTNGMLHASGEWHPGPDFGSLQLSGGWNDLALPLLSTDKKHQISSKTGTFTLDGGLNNYQFEINTDMAGQQLPNMEIKLSGNGNQNQVIIPQLTVLTLDGKVSGSARASWDPHINWEATFLAQEINPAIHWHEWPGRLNSRLHAYSKQTNSVMLTVIELKELTGQLRSYPVESHGTVAWGSKKINISDVRLDIGDTHFEMFGSRDEQWQLQAILNSPDLNTLWPYSKGKLELRANVTGPRLTPHIIAKINGEKIAIEDYRIGELVGDFDIDLQSNERFITVLSAKEIAKDSRQWQDFTINADGTRTQHQIKLELKQETEFLRLVVNAGLNEQQVWRGEIAQTIFNINDFGTWQQKKPAPFSLEANLASIGPWCLTQPGAHICLQGERKQNIWNARLDANNLSLAVLENWAPSHLRLHGKSNIEINLHYIPKDELTGDLLVSIPDGLRLEVADKEQSFQFSAGKMQASLNTSGLEANLHLPAAELGDMALQLNLPDWNALSGLQPDQALTGHFQASLASLAHLNGFFLDYPDLTGSMNTNLRFDGTIGAPVVSGETSINQASALIPALGIKLENINLRAVSKTGSRVDYQLSVRSGGGDPLNITGYTLLQMPDGWPTKMNIRGNNFQLANLPDVKVDISPGLDVEVQGRRIDLKGEITIPHARFRPRTLPKTSVSPSRDVVIMDQAELPAITERWKIYSHVRVILGDHVYFDGFGLRGELKGNLLLIDEPGKLTVGQGEINITEGTYKAYGQDAKIRRGRLMFANTVVDNPGVDLEAVREVDTVTAGVRVRGTLKEPELSLFSEPAMSESDIISYFLLGRPMQTTENGEGQQLQKALLAARLAGGELFVDQTGIYSYIDELSLEADKTTEQTSLVVGKYLSPKLYVRYVTGIIESSNIVEIHYKLSKYLRVQTEAGYRGSSSVTGADIYYTIEY